MAEHNKKTLLVSAGLVAIAAVSGGFGLMYSQGVNPLGDRAIGASTAEESIEENKPEILLSRASESVPSGLYAYGGSTTMEPIRQVMEPHIQKIIPNFQLRYTDPIGKAPSSTSGIQMLLDGRLAFSESARPIQPEEYEAAQQQGFKLEQIAVAVDGVAIAVNPELPIEGLTLAELSGIYQGRITNWSEVGGPDLEIQPLSRSPLLSSTAGFFAKNVLAGTPLGNNVAIVRDTRTALRKVMDSPGAIYYASAPDVVPQCAIKPLPLAMDDEHSFILPYEPPLVETADCYGQRNQLNVEAFRTGTYPLTRQLFVVVKKNGTAEEEAGRAYADILLTPEGQALIETAGFIRIN
ncbi:MAG: PstS family phosphate ABC transporter substrate-binding protein [Leptolyngbyaceae cyanobacterium]